MKKIFLLCSIIMCGMYGYGQTLTAASTTVENGGTVTVNVSGETTFRNYQKNSISFNTLAVSTDPYGLYSLLNINSITWVQEFNVLGSKPTKFSFKISNPTDKPIKVTIPFKGILQNTFDKNKIEIVDNGWLQNLVVTVNPTKTQPTKYYNVAASRTFTKNDCAAGTEGNQITYTVPANKYEGSTQADADAKAQNEINANGQANANSKGQCLIMYYNTAQTGSFTKNTCQPNYISGPSVPFTIQAGRFKATSQSAADALAINALNSEGQANANANGTCVKVTIYAKLVSSNTVMSWGDKDQNGNPVNDGSWRSTREDYYIELYSDAARTIPFNASNLSINVNTKTTYTKKNGVDYPRPLVENSSKGYVVNGSRVLLEKGFYILYANATNTYNGYIELASGDYIK